MRASNEFSRFSPVTAYAGTPDGRARVAISTALAPASVCPRRRGSAVTTPRAARRPRPTAATSARARVRGGSEGGGRVVGGRGAVMKGWVDGVDGKPFFQKRAPGGAPEWLQTATVTFPSGRHARELVPNDAAHLVWGVNLGVIDWNPWPVRRADLDHPDELRVDLDPAPGVPFGAAPEVALLLRQLLHQHGLRPLPHTSGPRGVH